MAGQSFPDGRPFLALAEIQLCDVLLSFLKTYRISIAIVVFDNLFLVAATLGWHWRFLWKAGLRRVADSWY